MGFSFDSTTQVIALILYHWVNWLFIVFAIAYFKRFFWTCILVVFAPVMAIMYAFGQQTKQIYSNWLKEFTLNAFVQPFHLVVYTVLISFPLDITNGGSFTFSWGNGTEMVYALMAMSMIRPAEKYLRRLFNLDKGVANMASYDSGKQTITDTAKAIAKAVKTAVAVGATVMTAGAAGGAMAAMKGAGGALGAQGAAGALGSQGAAGALGSQGAAGALGEAGGALGDAGNALGQIGQQGGNGLGGLGEGAPNWISEGWDTDSQGRFLNPYNDEWYTQDELNAGKDLPGYMEQDSSSGNQIASKLGTGTETENAGNINASAVTINTSSVNVEGATLDGGNNNGVQAIEEAKIEGDVAANNDADNNGADEKDDGIVLEEGKEGEEGGEQPSFFEIFKNKGGIEKLGELGNDLIDGAHSISAGLYVDGMAPTQEWNSNSQWRRENIKEAGEKRKENLERAKDNWANNKTNISIMQDRYYEKELAKAKEKYAKKDSSGNVIGYTKEMGYIESEAKEKSETKAKAALKDMSAYVEYGVTDVNQAYNLYQNANDNNFSPEQSIRNMAGYQKFNSDSGNVGQINLSGNFQRNDYTSVEAAIPNAKTYYDAGYTNVNDMAWVNYMAEKLGKSPEFAMKIDEELKKKGKAGKLSYNGKDAEMKKVIDQINSRYGG